MDFRKEGGWINEVDDVKLKIEKREKMGIVGERG